MRKFFIALLVVQVALICVGIWQLTQGKIDAGLFNIILNLVFGTLNFYNIKEFKSKEL
jgi:uncharacterized membrane protein YiaA